MTTRAVIYAPHDQDTQRWISACLDHCTRHRYEVVHTVIGGVERHWPELARWLIEGRADVIVTARPDHLPTQRTPRVESASTPDRMSISRRRPNRVAR